MLQKHAELDPEWLFTVTAGDDAATRGGYTILCALAQGRAVRHGEPGFSVYHECCRLAVSIAGKIDMLNHMSGKNMDTPLMKAAANGNKFLLECLLRVNARSSHLGYLIPPIWLVYF